MSFHGWTGSGKNHVSKIISEGIFKLGMKSQYVHLYVSTVNFPHEKDVDIYKVRNYVFRNIIGKYLTNYCY